MRDLPEMMDTLTPSSSGMSSSMSGDGERPLPRYGELLRSNSNRSGLMTLSFSGLESFLTIECFLGLEPPLTT